jgi:hypothetical protein
MYSTHKEFRRYLDFTIVSVANVAHDDALSFSVHFTYPSGKEFQTFRSSVKGGCGLDQIIIPHYSQHRLSLP